MEEKVIDVKAEEIKTVEEAPKQEPIQVVEGNTGTLTIQFLDAILNSNVRQENLLRELLGNKGVDGDKPN